MLDKQNGRHFNEINERKLKRNSHSDVITNITKTKRTKIENFKIN